MHKPAESRIAATLKALQTHEAYQVGRNPGIRPLRSDGEWVYLGEAYNIGWKTLEYLVYMGQIERRGKLRGQRMKNDWYRLVAGMIDTTLSDWAMDFGDLYIE